MSQSKFDHERELDNTDEELESMTPETSTLRLCEKGYSGRHFWAVVGNVKMDYLIYRCSQCKKCKLVKIKFVDGGYVEE